MVASCSSTSQIAQDNSPWAIEIAAAKEEAEAQNNHLILKILEDNEVSEIELQQVETTFSQCLVSSGFDGGGFNYRLEGGLNIKGAPEGLTPHEQERQIQLCIQKSGIEIINFAAQQLANPDHEDIVALSSRCMVARGLIKKEYTSAEIDDFIEDVEALSDADKVKAAECNLNPKQYLK